MTENDLSSCKGPTGLHILGGHLEEVQLYCENIIKINLTSFVFMNTKLTSTLDNHTLFLHLALS